MLLAAALLIQSACDRNAPRDAREAKSAFAADADRSPRQVVETLLEARSAGAYRAIESLILPERTEAVLSTLRAVDDFLLANRLLCTQVGQQIAPGLAAAIDQSHLGASLDIFSAGVRILAEHVEDERATVAFVVNDQLPVRRASLVRVGGRWLYDPGPGYDPSLPAAFVRMAQGLRQVAEDLRTGRVRAEAVRGNPQLLLDEIRLRMLPGLRMLPKPDGGGDGG